MTVRRHPSVYVWIKNQSKEKILLEVIKAYECCYPQRFAFFRQALRGLREVTVESHKDLKGRAVDINIRVPTELFLFLQSLIPDFGKDSDDINLLARVWEDFAVAKTRSKRTKKSVLWTKDLAPRGSGSPDPAETTPSSGLSQPTSQDPPSNAANGPQPPNRDCPADPEPSACLCRDDSEGLCRDAAGHTGID